MTDHPFAGDYDPGPPAFLIARLREQTSRPAPTVVTFGAGRSIDGLTVEEADEIRWADHRKGVQR